MNHYALIARHICRSLSAEDDVDYIFTPPSIFHFFQLKHTIGNQPPLSQSKPVLAFPGNSGDDVLVTCVASWQGQRSRRSRRRRMTWNSGGSNHKKVASAQYCSRLGLTVAPSILVIQTCSISLKRWSNTTIWNLAVAGEL